jgi:hypothetical protein
MRINIENENLGYLTKLCLISKILISKSIYLLFIDIIANNLTENSNNLFYYQLIINFLHYLNLTDLDLLTIY